MAKPRQKFRISENKHLLLTASLALIVLFLLSTQIKHILMNNLSKVFASKGPYAVILNNFTPIADTGTITHVSWNYVDHPSTTDWIGLYASGAADSAPIQRYFTSWTTMDPSGTTCPSTPGSKAQPYGSCMFPLPLNLPAGSYEYRLFANNSYTKLANAPLTITTPNLTASPSNITVGAAINFSWNLQAHSSYTNWIGFFNKGDSNSQRIDWVYVSCSKIPTTDIRNGNCSFTVPESLSSGIYEFRFFDDVYGQTGTSNPINVTGTTISNPTPTKVPDTTGPIVTITNPPANTQSIRNNIVQAITATVTDPSDVAKVEFYIDGNLLCTDTTTPYVCDWNVKGRNGVYYTILVKGYDTLGNSSSSSIKVYSW